MRVVNDENMTKRKKTRGHGSAQATNSDCGLSRKKKKIFHKIVRRAIHRLVGVGACRYVSIDGDDFPTEAAVQSERMKVAETLHVFTHEMGEANLLGMILSRSACLPTVQRACGTSFSVDPLIIVILDFPH